MAGPPLEQSTRFLLWPGGGVSLGVVHSCDLHAHDAVQLSVALTGTFRVRFAPRRPWTPCSAAAIPSGRRHEFDGGGAPVATVYLDASTAVARALAPRGGPRIRVFAADQISQLLPRLWTAADAPVTVDELQSAALEVVAQLAGVNPSYRRIDLRLEHALALVQGSLDGRIRVAEVARSILLPTDRFAHLFRAETGLPFGRYLLWLKLSEALREISTGATLDHAASRVGLSDAGHLTRAFRRLLGILPPRPSPEYA